MRPEPRRDESGGKEGGAWDARVVLGLLVLAGLCLRLFHLGAESLWLDETYSWHLSSDNALSILEGARGNRHTPPFYYFLLHYWMVFGDSEWAMRSLSALFGAAAIPLFYHLGRALRDRRAGYLAAGASTLSPFLVYYGQEARGYTLLLFFVLLQAILVRRFLTRRRARDALLFAAATVLSLYTHYYAVFLLAAWNVLVLYEIRRTPRDLGRWIACQAVIGLAFLPWVIRLFGAGFGGGQGFRRFLFLQIPYTFFRFNVGYGVLPLTPEAKTSWTEFVGRNLPWILGVFVFFGALVVRGLRRLSSEPDVFRFLVIPLAVPFLLALAVSLRSNLISERYLLVTFPFYLLVLIEGARGSGFGARALVWGSAALVFVALGMHYFNPRAGKTEWREAAALVAGSEEPGDAVLAIPSFVALPFRYYHREGAPVRGIRTPDPFEREPFERALLAYRDAPRVWAVVSHTRDAEASLRVLSERRQEIIRRHFPKENGVTVALFGKEIAEPEH